MERWNRGPSTARGRVLLSLLIIGLAWGSYVTYYAIWFGLNFPPSATGDEPFYDSLGWELHRGNGFRINTGDPEFRSLYEAAAAESPLYRLGPGMEGVITSRPPLYPLALAGVDLLFGRQFWAARSLNALLMACVGGGVFWAVLTAWGLIPALLSIPMFVLIDTHTRLSGRAILTEPMCAFWVMLLCLVLWRFQSGPGRRWIQLAGLLFGLAVLTRSMLILWLPGLLLVVGWLGWQGELPSAARSQRVLRSAGCAMMFLAVVIIVLLPWGIRNCVVLQRIMPTGTQGMAQLSAGFSDAAWESRGVWGNLEAAGFYEGVLRPEMTLLEQELAQADASRQRAKTWIQQNPLKALALFPMKIWQETLPRTGPQIILFILLVIGIWATRSWRPARLLLALMAVNLFTIGVTWSVKDGRFLLPLLFAQHVLAAAGLWWLICRVSGLPFRLVSRDRTR